MGAAKNILKVGAGLTAAAAAAVASYAAYLQLQYYRIEDGLRTPIEGAENDEIIKVGQDYKAVTFNIGFGAYTQDFTFFMDRGFMEDGTPTRGEHGRAFSENSVLNATNGAAANVFKLHPDFVLFQEVDTDSDRSHHVNQKRAITKTFLDYSSTYAVNFHSAYLAYPIPENHGRANSGILSLFDKKIDSAFRMSYPVDQSFPEKFFDLDRCFEVMKFPVDNGRELVLINSHMSAYDRDGVIRSKQLERLCDVLSRERSAGNYVIAGGDWNHALCNSQGLIPSKQQVPPWVSVLNDSDLPEGFSIVRASNIDEVGTCRGSDIPYKKGVTYTVTVDGFVVSDNVSATARNIDTGFSYSDHNPVEMTFELL
ncbi:MAG: endonuclease/exonuclease/phosphatase family protein [Coriobacteriales bacterium]|jgi:endonuclease/exonuclease/phosphatase family metal-dependent hydrolase